MSQIMEGLHEHQLRTMALLQELARLYQSGQINEYFLKLQIGNLFDSKEERAKYLYNLGIES